MAGVKDIDHGWQKLRIELLRLTDPHMLYVGIQGQDVDREGGGPNNAEIGTWHEFGTSTGVPARSFLRATLDAFRTKYADLLERLLGKVVDGKMGTEQALGLLGERVVADVRRRIKNGIAPDLTPATIRRKTRVDGAVANVPLILTAQLIHAISWVVRKGERKAAS